MAWPTVTHANVSSLWRPLTAAEQTVVTARIKVVEAELRRELRLHGVTGTPTLGDPGYETAEQVAEWVDLYTGVVVDVVKEAVKNPEGWQEERESIDDYERTRRRDDSSSDGVSFLSLDDVAKLLPPRRRRRGAFSIHLGQT